MTNIGEQYAFNYLVENGYSVQDVTNNPEYFYQDIDLIATDESGTHSIEVKWDKRISQTGNMFIETSSNVEEQQDGWFKFCKADLIFYGDSKNMIFYVFSLNDLKEYIDTYKTEQRSATDYRSNGSIRKLSLGEIVPIKDFSSKYNVQIIYLQS